jgi:lipoprotein-releasing system permease protein
MLGDGANFDGGRRPVDGDRGAMTDAPSPMAVAPAPPFGPFEWMIALRFLRGRRARRPFSAFAVVCFSGMVVSVATLIVVMSVMNGFHIELLNKIVGVNGHAFLQAVDTPLTDYEAVAARAKATPGVTLAIPMLEAAVGVASPYRQTGGLARGIKGEDLKTLPGVAGNVTLGTLDGFDAAGGVAIGAKMAENLSLRIGDTLSLLTAKGAETPFGVTPRLRTFPVVAIFQIGVSEFDNLFVYMPLDDAQSFFNQDGEANVVEVFVRDPEDMDAMRDKLEFAVKRPVIVTDWRQRNRSFFDALAIERNVMFLILSLMVIVAALNIVSGLIMLVKDKGRAIAILRTMGATRGAILRVFLLTGGVVGVCGTAAGLLLGFLIARNVEGIRQFVNRVFHINAFDPNFYLLNRLPSSVSGFDVALVGALALGLALLATIYPSWRAARLDPVDALRYE